MRLWKWNENKKIQENKDVVCKAEKGDYLFSYKGYYFLCQRKGDVNNIVWAQVNKPRASVYKAFSVYRKKLIKKGIQYAQITTDYELKFTAYIHILEELDIDYVYEVSEEKPRYCIVVKLFED